MTERLPDEILSNIFSIACHTSEFTSSAGLLIESGHRLELARFTIHPHGLKGCGPNFPLVNKRWKAVVESDIRLWKTVCQWDKAFPADLGTSDHKEGYVSRIKEGIFRHGASDIDIYLHLAPQLWDILAPLSNRWRDFQATFPDNLPSDLLPTSLNFRYNKLETLTTTVYTFTQAEVIQSTFFATGSPENPVLLPRLRELTNVGDPTLIMSLLTCVSLDSVTAFTNRDILPPWGEPTDKISARPRFPNLDLLRFENFTHRAAFFLSAIVAPKLRFLQISELNDWRESIPNIISLPNLQEFHLSHIGSVTNETYETTEKILSRLDVPNLHIVHLTSSTILFGIQISKDPGVNKFFQNVKKFTFSRCESSHLHFGHDTQAIFQKMVNVEDIILDIPPSRQNPVFQSLYGNALEFQGMFPNVEMVQLPAPEIARWKTLRIRGRSMEFTQFQTLVKALEYRRDSFNWRLERLEMMDGKMTKAQRRKLSELVDVVIDDTDRDRDA